MDEITFLKKELKDLKNRVSELESQINTLTPTPVILSSSSPDPALIEVLRVLWEEGKASASMIQTKLSLGYARAARIIDELEKLGIVGRATGNSRPRDVNRIAIEKYMASVNDE